MSEVARIPKPDMRNMLINGTKKHLVFMIAFSVGMGLLYKYTVTEPKRRRYEEFFRNYDPEKHIREWCEAGHMVSCRPGDYK